MTNPSPKNPPRWAKWIAISLIPIAIVAVLAWKYSHPKSTDTEPLPREAPFPVAEVKGPEVFEDVTASSGVDFTYRNGEEAQFNTILESLGGGVALFDYDLDGRMDIFLTGGGSFQAGTPPQILGAPNRLYRNLGDFKFEDVTEKMGLNKPIFYSHGASVTDIDRDGFPDLLLTGWDRVVLYHNRPNPAGGRQFVDITQSSGLTDNRWSTSAAWGDLDGDGYPDLYVCYYVDWSFANDPPCPDNERNGMRDVCPPQRFGPLQDRLYRNKGDGTFEDVTNQATLRKDGKGLGVLMADVDADGRTDIYVANDGGENFLYLNKGGMHFQEMGTRAGVSLDDNGMYNGSMGVDAADFDGTGLASIWVTNFQGEYHALYRNLGSGRFRHHSQTAGIGRLGQRYVGFGTRFVDFDRDGWEDLVVANGHVVHRPTASSKTQQAVLLRNEEHDGRRQFRELPGRGGAYFQAERVGRGLAVGDLDNDGWPDLVVSHQNTPVAILRNVSFKSNHAGNHWLGIELVGKDRRDLVGTKLVVEIDGRRLTRFVNGGSSYLSTSDPRMQIGLGSGRTPSAKIAIHWPNAAIQRFEISQLDRYFRIEEGHLVLKEIKN